MRAYRVADRVDVVVLSPLGLDLGDRIARAGIHHPPAILFPEWHVEGFAIRRDGRTVGVFAWPLAPEDLVGQKIDADDFVVKVRGDVEAAQLRTDRDSLEVAGLRHDESAQKLVTVVDVVDIDVLFLGHIEQFLGPIDDLAVRAVAARRVTEAKRMARVLMISSLSGLLYQRGSGAG